MKNSKLDSSKLQHVENTVENQQHFEDNKNKFSKQCTIVYEAFLRGERLTTASALINYKIGDLRRRVKDLKDLYDIPVESKMIGRNYKEYFLNL